MRRRAGLAFALVIVAAAIGAAPAPAAETRAEYVAQTDRICKNANRDLITVFRHLKKNIKIDVVDPDSEEEEPTKEETRKALSKLSRIFGKANKVFGRMVREISLVAIPTGDEQAVVNWLSGLRAYRRLNDRANRALKKGQIVKWIQRIVRSFESLQNGALAVKDFGYRNCPAGDLEGDVVFAAPARAYAHSSGS